MSVAKQSGAVPQIYKFHWHVLFTHFPVSLLIVAFGFHLLNIWFAPPGFGLATDIVFIAAVAILVPASLTGWLTWEKAYKGARLMLFQRKIAVCLAMMVIGLPLGVWRAIMLITGMKDTGLFHWVYFAGNGLLIIGAIIEGYYGGRLSHR